MVHSVVGDEEILETTLAPNERPSTTKAPEWWRRGLPAPTQASIDAAAAEHAAACEAGRVAADAKRAKDDFERAAHAATKPKKSTDPLVLPEGATLIEPLIALREADGRHLVFLTRWQPSPAKSLDAARSYLTKLRDRAG